MISTGQALPAGPPPSGAGGHRFRQRRWRSMVAAAAATILAATGATVAATAASAATVDPSAWYVLVNRNSGKALDVYGLATNDGGRIIQWSRHGQANQQWQFVDSGGGYYRIRSRHSSKVLDVSGRSTADGAAIVQWGDHNGPNQQFRLVDSDGGYVRLISRHSNKAVQVQGAATNDGANVVQWTDSGGTHQQWQLVRVGGGTDPTTPPPTTPPPTTPPPTTPPPTTPPPDGPLPSSLRWSSSGVLAGPKPDAAHPDVRAIKDFTVVRHNNAWQVYATTASPSQGWNLVHFSFPDWPQANAAMHTYLDTATPIGRGYRAAPHIFYFAPHNLWYMVYQTGVPTYSTSTDPSNPRSWTTPRNFMNSEPAIVTQNKGNGAWLDFWMICDSVNCYLFSSDDNGHIYRSQTTVANFPSGFGNTVIALSDSRAFNLFEGGAVYKVQGQNQYLLLQEAIGSDGRRWYRSFTSGSLNGSWTPHLATESNPFARSNNVTFAGTAWTRDFSHGELIRAGNDQTVPLNPCKLQFLYQGMDPNAGGDYISLPWRMGLLTQTNSTC